MMKIAADFAGYAQDQVEADYPGVTAVFVTWRAGDADPHPFGTLAMAKDHGEELAAAVKFLPERPSWMINLTGPLRSAYNETTLRFAGPTDRASYEKRLNDPNQGRRQHVQRIVEALDHGRPIANEYPYYSVHAFALGDQLTLVALSGEVVVDTRSGCSASWVRKVGRCGLPRMPTTYLGIFHRSGSSRKEATKQARRSTAALGPSRWLTTLSRS